MSEHCTGNRRDADAAGSRVDRRADPGAVGASPWINYDGALERSHVVLAADARAGVHHGRPGSGGAARAAAHPDRISSRGEGPRRVGEGIPAAAVPRRVRWRPSAGLAGADDVRTGACRTPPSRRSPAGLQRLGRPGLEAALVALDPQTGDILAMVGGGDYTRSTFNRATRSRRQPGSAFKPFVYAAALARGYSPVSVLKDLDRVSAPRQAIPNGRRATREGEHADSADAACRADRTRTTRPPSDLQQQVGSGAVLRLASDAGLQRPARRAVARARHGLVSPLELATAVHDVSGRRRDCRAARDVVRHRRAWRGGVRRRAAQAACSASRSRSRWSACCATSSIAAPERGPRARRPGAGRRQDRHDRRVPRCLVRRLLELGRRRRVGRLRQPATIGRDAYAARVALPIWADFMKRIARARPPAAVCGSRGLQAEELCSVSYLQPVQQMSDLRRSTSRRATRFRTALCPIHRGTLKQRTTRAVQGFFRLWAGS